MALAVTDPVPLAEGVCDGVMEAVGVREPMRAKERPLAVREATTPLRRSQLARGLPSFTPEVKAGLGTTIVTAGRVGEREQRRTHGEKWRRQATLVVSHVPALPSTPYMVARTVREHIAGRKAPSQQNGIAIECVGLAARYVAARALAVALRAH